MNVGMLLVRVILKEWFVPNEQNKNLHFIENEMVFVAQFWVPPPLFSCQRRVVQGIVYASIFKNFKAHMPEKVEMSKNRVIVLFCGASYPHVFKHFPYTEEASVCAPFYLHFRKIGRDMRKTKRI